MTKFQLNTLQETFVVTDVTEKEDGNTTFTYNGVTGWITPDNVAYIPTPFGRKVYFDAELEEINEFE